MMDQQQQQQIPQVLDQLMSDMECYCVWHTRSISAWTQDEFTVAMQNNILKKHPSFEPTSCPPYEVLFVLNKAKDFYDRQQAILQQASRLVGFIADRANLVSLTLSKSKWSIEDLVNTAISEHVEQMRKSMTMCVNKFMNDVFEENRKQQSRTQLDAAQIEAISRNEKTALDIQQQVLLQQQAERDFAQLNASATILSQQQQQSDDSIKCVF